MICNMQNVNSCLHKVTHISSDNKSECLPNIILVHSQHAEPLNMHQLFQTYLDIAGFRSNAEK